MDRDLSSFLAHFSELAEAAARQRHEGTGPLLNDCLQEHLGVDPSQLASVGKEVPPYRFGDFDVALEALSCADGQADSTTVGIAGDQRHHMSLADMISTPWARLSTGQVDWASIAVGPVETRRVMALGIRLFSFLGQPVAVLQRRASQMHGNGTGVIEVLCRDPEVATALLERAASLSTERSLLRGKVLSLEMVGYEGEGDGFHFLPRPELSAQDVILPPGRLERIAGHIIGIAGHSQTLQRHGQHLKRGVLLYGPPGTGKTHTVRHLISATPAHTVILLSGATLQFIGQAAALARHLQPSIVVLEDCDLVAMDRGFSPTGNPLLFDVLDALDGLDADADVAFLLTTNRVEVLEEALAQRPGRVDLAVEIPLPDEEARRRLLALYRGTVAFSDTVLDEVAARSDHHTASFFKELIRRSVLIAATAGRDPSDGDLIAALDSLQVDQEALSRSLLGIGQGDGQSAGAGGPDVSGWAYQPYRPMA